MLETLPPEILFVIFDQLAPENVLALRLVNKTLATLNKSDEIWRVKFEIHFPERFLTLQKKRPFVAEGTWYSEFKNAYEDEYSTLSPRLKPLFSRVKEGKDEDFTDVSYEDLKSSKDKGDQSLVCWARAKNNQSALDYFYLVLEDHFARCDIEEIEEIEDLKNKMVKYAILLRQPLETVKKLVMDGGVPYIKSAARLASDGNLVTLEFLFTPVLANGRPLFSLNDFQKSTLLSCAAINGHLAVVDYILEQAFPKNGFGKVAMFVAAKDGHLEVIKRLLSHDKTLLDQKNKLGQTALFYAAANGRLEVAQYLVEQGADIHVRTHSPNPKDKSCNGRTALYLAVERGHFEVVQWLLKKGADLNIQSENNHTAFTLAAQEGHLDVIQVLLSHDRTLLDQKDKFGQTALLWAASKGHVEIVQYLLVQSADPSVQTHGANLEENKKHNGRTPLHWAAAKGHLNVVKALLEHNKNLANAMNFEGVTPLILAHEGVHAEVKACLLQCLIAPSGNAVNLSQLLLDRNTEFYQNTLLDIQIRSDFKLDWIKESSSMCVFLTELSEEQFKAFFSGVVNLGICSIDEVLLMVSNMAAETQGNLEANQKFIKDRVDYFSPYRHEIELLINVLEEKIKDLKSYPERAAAIGSLVSALKRETNKFFTNPTEETLTDMRLECFSLVYHAEVEINVRRTSEFRAVLNKILLITAHILIVTIPVIWLHPASRNLLLNKTDTQAKAEVVHKSIRSLERRSMRGEFNSFFSPAPEVVARSEVSTIPRP